MRLAGAELMALRRYKPAAALLEEAAQRHANAEAMRQLADRLRTTTPARGAEARRSERRRARRGSSSRRFFGLAATADPVAFARLESVITPAFAAGIETETAQPMRRMIRTMIRSNADLKAHPGAGDRRRARLRGGDGRGGAGRRAARLLARRRRAGRAGAALVLADGGHFRVLGHEPTICRRSAARRCGWRADKGDLDRARRLLDYAASDASLGTADEPLSASPLVALWTKGAAAPARDVRIAAAALLATAPKPTEAIAPLVDCRAHPAQRPRGDRLRGGAADGLRQARPARRGDRARRRAGQALPAIEAGVPGRGVADGRGRTATTEVRALLEARDGARSERSPDRERARQPAARDGGLRAWREGARRSGQGRRAAVDGLQPARLAAPPARAARRRRRWPPRSAPSNRASVTTPPSCTRWPRPRPSSAAPRRPTTRCSRRWTAAATTGTSAAPSGSSSAGSPSATARSTRPARPTPRLSAPRSTRRSTPGTWPTAGCTSLGAAHGH